MDEEVKHALGVLLLDEGETVAGGAAPRAVVEGASVPRPRLGGLSPTGPGLTVPNSYAGRQRMVLDSDEPETALVGGPHRLPARDRSIQRRR
jgi:hypothetical protein